MRVIVVRFLCLIGLCMMLAGTAAGAITIEATPSSPDVGDRVFITGHSATPHVIAAYLFVTGPGLDRAGVTLENLNLKAGYGHFTSAFVHPDGTFAYEWNTAFIAGRLVPGTYRIYAVDVPLNLERLTDTDEINMTFFDVTFTERPSTDIPLGWGMPLSALAFSAGVVAMRRRQSD